MKNRKALGIDSITAEVLKEDGKSMTEMPNKIFNAIWVHEQVVHKKVWGRMLVTPYIRRAINSIQATTDPSRSTQEGI